LRCWRDGAACIGTVVGEGDLREQGITNTTKVGLIALRGKVSTFNIINPETRARWARNIGPADVLLFDCLRPVFDALGPDESHEAGDQRRRRRYRPRRRPLPRRLRT
jgi:hypothetical protein